jgi:hypothetical protein
MPYILLWFPQIYYFKFPFLVMVRGNGKQPYINAQSNFKELNGTCMTLAEDNRV